MRDDLFGRSLARFSRRRRTPLSIRSALRKALTTEERRNTEDLRTAIDSTRRRAAAVLCPLWLALLLQRRQQRLTRSGQVLVGRVHHRAHREVVAHELHDLDGVLAAE